MNKNIKILLNYFLGPLLFIILSFSLYKQIINKPNLGIQWQQIKNSYTDYKLWLVVFLMVVNWGIEAIKWQLLVNHVQRFSFTRAFKSVLSGCSITMLTPNRMGEYGGRILYVAASNRIKAISLTIVGSISQLLVTMLMGCFGLFILRYISHYNHAALSVLPQFWQTVITSLSVGITVMLLLFYLRLGWLVRAMEKVPALHKIVRHISVLDEFNNRQLLQVLLLSFVRYLVFVSQYVLLLQVMEVNIATWLCFCLIAIFYLAMAVAPTFGFIDLPVRLTASWAILKLYTTNEVGVGAATLGIWLINLVVPAIIGSLLILSIKIVKEK
ncbi:MAG: flippase-like domain-containing protein [Ferruginibacter sp.]|nr:flippase-like domain-containing protein [Ferruginibacter sp.]